MSLYNKNCITKYLLYYLFLSLFDLLKYFAKVLKSGNIKVGEKIKLIL